MHKLDGTVDSLKYSICSVDNPESWVGSHESWCATLGMLNATDSWWTEKLAANWPSWVSCRSRHNSYIQLGRTGPITSRLWTCFRWQTWECFGHFISWVWSCRSVIAGLHLKPSWVWDCCLVSSYYDKYTCDEHLTKVSFRALCLCSKQSLKLAQLQNQAFCT